jgi:hypothetical protein
MDKINGILDNILKRILMTPSTTSRETLYIETGIVDVEHTMERNKMLMLNRLNRTSNKLIQTTIDNDHLKGWKRDVLRIIKENRIDGMENLEENTARRAANQAVQEGQMWDMITMGFFLKNKLNNNIPTTPRYIWQYGAIIYWQEYFLTYVRSYQATKYLEYPLGYTVQPIFSKSCLWPKLEV